MHVTLVSGFDADAPSASGTRSHVEALAGFLRNREVPHLVVTASSRWDIQSGWCRVPVRRPNSTFHFQAALASTLADVPIPRDSIVHVHRPDDLLPFVIHGSGRSRVCTLHGNPGRYVPTRHGPVVSGLYRIAERFALRRMDRIIAVDSRTASEYGRRYPWLRERIRTIPNGIDTAMFHPMNRERAKQGWGLDGTVLLYAGRLESDKHVRDILHAFLALRPARTILVFAGGGRERGGLEVEAAGSSVRFLGPVARGDMPSLINAADAAVLFSDEGLSSFALEALACGVPVIATPTGDLPKVIRPGENGLFVSNLEELGAAMRGIADGALAADSSLAASVRQYAWSEVGRRLLALYLEVWDGRTA